MAPEKAQFIRGTKVGVRFAGRVRAAIVVEDRGIFGGERIVRIRLTDWDDVGPHEFELRQTSSSRFPQPPDQQPRDLAGPENAPSRSRACGSAGPTPRSPASTGCWPLDDAGERT